MLKKKLNQMEWIYLTLSILLTISISLKLASHIVSIPNDFLCQLQNKQLNCTEKLISFGEKRLIPTNRKNQITNKSAISSFRRYKQKGIDSFRNKDTGHAADEFKKAFEIYPDPETLIYQNNADAESQQHIQIAVSVPISQNLDIAEEILRGVAQAQDEINQSDQLINGKWLQIGIADDKNDPKFAEAKIAPEAVNNPNILAVVGHNASIVSQAAARIYNQGELVMITPTSYAMTASYYYGFKVVSNVNILANQLNKYYGETKLNKLFICYDEDENVSKIFNSYFHHLKKIVSTDDDCNVSSNNFTTAVAISQAKNNNADSLLLATSVQKINSFIELAKLAKANNSKIALFGSSTLYTHETLAQGKEAVKDMVLVAPWHPDAFPNNPFRLKAQELWKGKVNWRTAMAYDATKVIIEGLKRSTNRQELAAELHRNIPVCGATGEISFKSSGERRQEQAFIIKVVKDSRTDTGYNFTLVDPIAKNNFGQSCNNQ